MGASELNWSLKWAPPKDQDHELFYTYKSLPGIFNQAQIDSC